MKGKTILLLIGICSKLIAQEVKDTLHHHISVNFIGAISIGDYKSTDLNNSQAGYAKNGFGLGLNYSHKIYKSLNFHFNVSYFTNKINESIVGEQAVAFTETQTTFSNIQSNVSSTPWKNLIFMGGFGYRLLSENKKFNIEPILCLGANYLTTPEINYEVRIGNTSFSSRTSSSKAWAFAYAAGANFNFRLNNFTSSHIFINYQNTQSNGHSTNKAVLGNLNYNSSTYNYKINNSSLLIGIGFTTKI